MGAEAYVDLLDAIHDPSVIHGMIEDYRAGLRIDHIHDREDREAGRKVRSPTLCGRRATTWSKSTAIPSKSGEHGPTMSTVLASIAAITSRRRTLATLRPLSQPFCANRRQKASGRQCCPPRFMAWGGEAIARRRSGFTGTITSFQSFTGTRKEAVDQPSVSRMPFTTQGQQPTD